MSGHRVSDVDEDTYLASADIDPNTLPTEEVALTQARSEIENWNLDVSVKEKEKEKEKEGLRFTVVRTTCCP
jgi:hypothetical protein